MAFGTGAAVLLEYWLGEHGNEDLLLDYVRRLGNRTVFKRLGFLLKHFEIDACETIRACLDNLSAGFSAHYDGAASRLSRRGPKSAAPMAVAHEQEMKANVVKAEAEVPLAMADALLRWQPRHVAVNIPIGRCPRNMIGAGSC